MKTVILLLIVSGLLLAQNHAEKTGFIVTPDGISTTNEATKGDKPRKILVNCKYEEKGGAISGCALADGATLSELVAEFESRDTKRVKEIETISGTCKPK